MAADRDEERNSSNEESLLFQQLLQYADDLTESYKREKERLVALEQAYEDLKRENEARRQTEQALMESEERFRAIFESVRDSVFIKDTSLKYVLVNPFMENLLALDASEIVERTDEDLFGLEAGAHLREVDLRVLQGEAVEEQHTRRVKGAALTFLDIRAPMRNSAGEIIGICGIAHNITGREPPRPMSYFEEDEYPSPTMGATLTAARMAAQSDSIVLLTGESGTGKDYLARYIHDHSKRANGPFFVVNCASIPAELAEAELFGHELGAFTGAHRRVRGLFELAEGGTLLMNEIGELPMHLQAKLLAFLDTRSFTRVGGREGIKINARLIAATNRDLEKEVAERNFRADLFYRLNVLSIRVPPLRERLEDLPVLIRRIVAQLVADLQLPRIPELHLTTIRRLADYEWPGNVREVRNFLERQLILSGGQRLHLESPVGDQHQPAGWTTTVQFPRGRSLDDAVDDLIKTLVEEALKRSGGKMQGAAKLLGISRHTLRRRMKAVGLIGSESEA